MNKLIEMILGNGRLMQKGRIAKYRKDPLQPNPVKVIDGILFVSDGEHKAPSCSVFLVEPESKDPMMQIGQAIPVGDTEQWALLDEYIARTAMVSIAGGLPTIQF